MYHFEGRKTKTPSCTRQTMPDQEALDRLAGDAVQARGHHGSGALHVGAAGAVPPLPRFTGLVGAAQYQDARFHGEPPAPDAALRSLGLHYVVHPLGTQHPRRAPHQPNCMCLLLVPVISSALPFYWTSDRFYTQQNSTLYHSPKTLGNIKHRGGTPLLQDHSELLLLLLLLVLLLLSWMF